jgi:hypothetical protein
MLRTLGQIRKTSRAKNFFALACGQLHFAVEHIKKALCRRRPERSARGKLRSHLRKARAQLRRHVDDELDILRFWQRRADKRVRRLEQVICLQAASGYSQMVQGFDLVR